MNRKAFHQLLKKYVDGKCTDEEKHLIDQWYQLLDDSSLLPINEEEMNGIEERLWKKIQSNIILENKSTTKKTYSLVSKISIAAAVIGLICLAAYYYLPAKKSKDIFKETTATKGLKQIKNETAVVKKVLLEDSSIVSLQPGAAIAFPEKFAADKKRSFFRRCCLF